MKGQKRVVKIDQKQCTKRNKRIVQVHKAPKKTHRNIRDQEKKFLDYVVEWTKACSNDAADE